MKEITDTLFIIPARGGSKELPRKNILPLNGKPMILYTIDAARGVTLDENICVSTDDAEIKKIVEDYGLKIPFLRPVELASDTATSQEVILHAIDFFQKKFRRFFSKVCLLQPTSPLRTSKHIYQAYMLWDDKLDMIVSVKESKANPYYNLFEENKEGYLEKSKKSNFTRRQDAPKAWELNGAIYYISIKSIRKKHLNEFTLIKKFLMDSISSIDIDSEVEFVVADFLKSRNYDITLKIRTES